MTKNLEIFLIDLGETLHFVGNDKGIWRYGSRGFYDQHKADKYATRQLCYSNWESAPASLTALNRAIVTAAPCNYVNDIASIMNFDFMWGVADLQMHNLAKALKITVSETTTYVVYTGCSVKYLREWSFCHSQFSGIRLYEAKYPCYSAVPIGLRKLMELTIGLDYYGDEPAKMFMEMWDYFTVAKEVNTEVTVPTNPPYKALMMFEDIQTANGYDRDVYLYSSAGIKRMTFTEYLRRVEAAHSGDYRLAKVIKSNLSGLDIPNFEALQKMTSPQNGNKLGTIYMCFRALWYAATGETMSTTAWEGK